MPPPGGEFLRQLRRWRRGGTAAVSSARGRACAGSSLNPQGHVRRSRPSHRRRQVPGADGAQWRGAEGGRRHSAWRRRQHTDDAGGHPAPRAAADVLLAHRSDRRRVSTRGNAHAGRGRLHGVGARTQPPRSRSHHSAHALNRGPAARPATRPARRPPRPATRPAAGHTRAGPNSSRPSPPAARLAGSAEPRRDVAASRIWASAGRVAGRICRAARPGFGRRPGRTDLGGRPAGFDGSAGRFWVGFGGSAGRVGRAASRSPDTAQPPVTALAGTPVPSIPR